MKTFIGIGRGSTQTAIEESTKGIGTPSMILFMASYEKLREAAALIRKKFPNIPSIGTIGTKLANGTVEEDNITVLGLFQDAKVSCGMIEGLSVCPVTAVRELERKISEVAPGRENTVCVEFCTNQEERLVTLLNSCLEKKQVGLAGGTVFGVPDGKEPLVAYNGQAYTDACVYALIKNTTGRAKVFKENIYHKHSDISHFATKVNTEKHSLIELDGRPAADVYSRELGIPKDKIVDNVFENPMGRVVGDQVFISSMKELHPNGEIVNYKRINKNDCIYFLKLGDYRESERQTRELIRSELKGISLVLSVDCVYRYLLYQQEGYFLTYAKEMAALGPHMGVVGGGEQFNNQHVNQTMVCAVFE